MFDGKALIPEEAVNLEPLSSLEALDLSEPDNVRELLNLIASEVIFCDEIGREFKGSAAVTLEAIQFWKGLVGL